MSDPTRQQSWTAQTYERDGGFVSDLTGDVLALLEARPGEHILDLGCGDGRLTERIVAQGATVVGIDTSDDLLDAARARGLDARFGDGEKLEFDQEFDAVFSNAALHWMLDAPAVASGMWNALKPGGRLVAEFGGSGNLAAIITAIRYSARNRDADMSLAGPWFYPTPEEYRAVLEQAGFVVESVGLFARPTPLPTGLTGWLQTFRKAYFDQFTQSDREAVLAEIEDILAPILRDTSETWRADYVRIRVKAEKPA